MLQSRGHNGIYVVADRLTKIIRLAATKPDCTAAAVALLFQDHVYRNYGLPKDVVCDRDPVFFSNFWKALTDILNVKIRASSAYHPQTDGQTEIMNKKVEETLRNSSTTTRATEISTWSMSKSRTTDLLTRSPPTLRYSWSTATSLPLSRPTYTAQRRLTSRPFRSGSRAYKKTNLMPRRALPRPTKRELFTPTAVAGRVPSP